MAHEIAFANGKAQMMYVGETPWHGLGVKLATPPATVGEALKAAGLDGWNVKLQQLQLSDGRKVDCWATVRADGAILGSGMGGNYRVVQNEVALAPFEPFLRSGSATVETAGALKGGSKVWLLAKIARPDAVIVPRSDDRVAQYLLVATSHDGSIAVTFLPTPTRVVCNNTLSIAMNLDRQGRARTNNGMRIRHTDSAAASLDAVTNAIEKMDANFRSTADMWRALAGKSVTETQVRAYIDAVFPPPPAKPAKSAPAMVELDDAIGTAATFASLLSKPARLKAQTDELGHASEQAETSTRRVADNIIEILERGGRGLDMPGVRGTAWGAYNAVTEYLTWERGRSNDNRMASVWFGDVGKRALSAAADTFLS